MTEKFTLYLGLNDKDSKKQEMSTVEAYKLVSKLALDNGIEGATIFEAVGIYTHEDGTVVTENTLRIELLFFGDELATPKTKAYVDDLKKVLRQESVAVQHQVNIESDLW